MQHLSTASIAVPGSVIDNAQTAELATSIAGTIARTAAIFNIDEVVILDDSERHGEDEVGRGAAFLVRILQYLETPQYLRKALIPMHKDLTHVGLLPPLDAPHHMRATEWCSYREGRVLSSKVGEGSLVDVGLDKEAHVAEALRVGVRVTLRMGDAASTRKINLRTLQPAGMVYQASVCTPLEPRESAKLYWGYHTRLAKNLSEMISLCPFKGGYDLTIGTSEHGSVTPACEFHLPTHRHLLIVFGGPLGLEECFSRQDSLSDKPSTFFNMYINTCPNQGSRTIRTEEAIPISLAYLQPSLAQHLSNGLQ